MNYLAHAYLSGQNEEILIGNFIADAVKGKALNEYQIGVKKGIQLHRAIDDFTDRHRLHKASRSKLHHRYGHYSGVLVDIFYDHFLAKNWLDYSNIELAEYTNWLYNILDNHKAILPERINHMLKYMVPQNWLLNYAHLEGIERVLQGMGNRAKFDSQMEHGVEDLKIHYSEFEDDFTQFMPSLEQFVREKIALLK